MSNAMNSLMAQWVQKGKQKFNRDTFFHATYADWREVSKPPDRPPDYSSGSYSKYWFTDSGVYRCANHWGNVASCKWALDGKQVQGEVRTGYCTWSKFQDMTHPYKNAREKYYDDCAVRNTGKPEATLKHFVDWDNGVDTWLIERAKKEGDTERVKELQDAIAFRNSLSEKEFKKYKRPEWTKLPF